jgi:hypothetical protein
MIREHIHGLAEVHNEHRRHVLTRFLSCSIPANQAIFACFRPGVSAGRAPLFVPWSGGCTGWVITEQVSMLWSIVPQKCQLTLTSFHGLSLYGYLTTPDTLSPVSQYNSRHNLTS